jgi:hypothetical protein
MLFSDALEVVTAIQVGNCIRVVDVEIVNSGAMMFSVAGSGRFYIKKNGDIVVLMLDLPTLTIEFVDKATTVKELILALKR